MQKDTFCLISKNKLNALKELSKREEREKNNLKNALDEIENILNACGEMACYTKSRCLLEEDIEDIEEIIKKVKGDIK